MREEVVPSMYSGHGVVWVMIIRVDGWSRPVPIRNPQGLGIVRNGE